MNKKILICSIISVVILVLVSFTGVVGFQTTKSSTIARASPLFTVRTSRAIDEESRDIARDYVGKGKESILSIPKRNETKIEMEKLLDILIKMDDKTFNNFIKQIIKDKRFKDRDIQTIKKELFHLRNTYKEKQFTYDTPVYCVIRYGIEYIIRVIFAFYFVIVVFFAMTQYETLLDETCRFDPYCTTMILNLDA